MEESLFLEPVKIVWQLFHYKSVSEGTANGYSIKQKQKKHCIKPWLARELVYYDKELYVWPVLIMRVLFTLIITFIFLGIS